MVQIENEVDHIIRETLDKYDHGVIEEGALTALGIAIEQFRSVAASRNFNKRRSYYQADFVNPHSALGQAFRNAATAGLELLAFPENFGASRSY